MPPAPALLLTPALLLSLALAFAPPAKAQDCIGCGPGTTAWMETELGQPLPDGVTFTGVLQGGFQDQFVQIRLSVPPGALDGLLAALGTSRTRLIPDPPLSREIVAADWWGLVGRRFVSGGDATFGHFAYAAVFVAPEDWGGHSLWLIAFDV